MSDIDKTFKPTTKWMAEKYQEMNQLLFNGALQECDFTIFTSGRGSQGKTLGWFKMQGHNLKAHRSTRKMFQVIYLDSMLTIKSEKYVTKHNFYITCKPLIGLNGNYSGTENAFLNTLVHEMCHYYTYMDGTVPIQAHGPEFRDIAERVSYKSNGKFTIQRLATAEEMNEFELSDEMKQKREKRLQNKKSKLNALFAYMSNGEIRLTTTSSETLIKHIIEKNQERSDSIRYRTLNPIKCEKMIISNDQNLIDLLYQCGYRNNMRTWRYWNVTNTDWIKNINNYDITTLNENMTENKTIRKNIIKEVIDEYLNNNVYNQQTDDDVDISNNMNLGLVSPIQ